MIIITMTEADIYEDESAHATLMGSTSVWIGQVWLSPIGVSCIGSFTIRHVSGSQLNLPVNKQNRCGKKSSHFQTKAKRRIRQNSSLAR